MPQRILRVNRLARVSSVFILLLAAALMFSRGTPTQAAPAYAVKILSAGATTKIMTGTLSTQVVEATVQNTGTAWFSPAHPAILKPLQKRKTRFLIRTHAKIQGQSG